VNVPGYTTNYNGYSIYTPGYSYNTYPNATGGYYDPPQTLVAGTGVWTPPNGSQVTAQSDIWNYQISAVTFAIFQCPSDPTANTKLVYGGAWGGTSYMANFNALGGSVGDGTSTDDYNGTWIYNQQGWWAPPVTLAQISDGTSTTILFGEGYQTCDATGRIALYAAGYHSFGITTAGVNPSYTITTVPPTPAPTVNMPNGMADTFMFQVKPLPLPNSECPAGATCCDQWRAQTGHDTMNITMLDGSVRGVNQTISQQTWNYVMQPNDGQALGTDW
jgi:Protein of unknown function (DUF1559)